MNKITAILINQNADFFMYKYGALSGLTLTDHSKSKADLLANMQIFLSKCSIPLRAAIIIYLLGFYFLSKTLSLNTAGLVIGKIFVAKEIHQLVKTLMLLKIYE